MKGIKVNVNLNQSNKNTDNAVNRIQNSLNKLQSTLNKNTNIGKRNKKNDSNIRKKILDSNNYDMKNKDFLLTETSIHDQIPIGYSMFNDRSVIRTDKRNLKMNQSGLDNYDHTITNISDNIPGSIHSRKRNSKKDKDIFNNNKYTSVIKWKCLNCGNINLLYNKNCINCGRSKNNQIKNKKNYMINIPRAHNNLVNYINTSYEKIDNEINNGHSSNNNSFYESSIGKENKHFTSSINCWQIPKRSIITKPKSTYNDKINIGREYLFNTLETNIIYNSNSKNNLTEISDDPNINVNMQKKYKKLNDLYLYGDYLETELKESNDENIKLLENVNNIKNDVQNLNLKNKKIKQKVEELQKKDKELKLLNNQLKNGFSLVQKQINIDFGKKNDENKNILKELELTNNKNLEKQKILKLTNEEEENDNNNNGKDIEELINNIEKEKKEMEENSDKYILLLKNNELLNQDIEKLERKIELNQLNKNDKKENGDPIKKLNALKENILLYDKEINENKIITNDLINEYKNLVKIFETETNDDNDNEKNDTGKDNNENDKKEYLLFKEKNNKLSEELLKLKDIIKNLAESKDKIVNIYENEINKLNNFYLKAKEKTMINKDENNDMIEIEQQKKLMDMHEENENIKKENFELIKDLEQLAQLQHIYQAIMEENEQLKSNIYSEENQNILKEIINSENINEKEKNDEE